MEKYDESMVSEELLTCNNVVIPSVNPDKFDELTKEIAKYDRQQASILDGLYKSLRKTGVKDNFLLWKSQDRLIRKYAIKFLLNLKWNELYGMEDEDGNVREECDISQVDSDIRMLTDYLHENFD